MLFESAWFAECEKRDKPKYVVLYCVIRSEIEKGNISENQLLPSIREVSRQLGISSTTAENAYNQLMVEGYIYSIPQKGYFAARLDKGFFSRSSSVREARTVSPKEVNSRYMDTGIFNFTEWRKIYTQVLDDYRHRLLLEGDPQGEHELREALSDYVYRARGVRCDPEQIIIGSGVQTLLSIYCDVTDDLLLAKVAFEEPGFVDVRPVFQKRGYSLHPIPLDKDGIKVGSLFQAGATTCYTSPSHQYPTGLVMPVQKRMELLRWAEQTGGYILEDDYDSELRFSGRPVPSLFSMDNEGHVIYLGSFSTLMAPSLRISYMILPGILSKAYRENKHNYRSTVSSAEQLALASYIVNGQFERHLRRLRKKCSARMKAFIAATNHHRKDINIYPTDTGTFVLLEARNQQIFEAIRKNSILMRLGLREVWEGYFAFEYANIQEEKFPGLLKEMIQIC
ncbi:MAG: PLP-dependent aminotransferase family protein [Ruminiclostridium sp.]|nr:PLP-dependent aminotransferase family protein [Ruminiclostridium sp.]